MNDWLRYPIALSVGVHGFVYLRVEEFVPSQADGLARVHAARRRAWQRWGQATGGRPRHRRGRHGHCVCSGDRRCAVGARLVAALGNCRALLGLIGFAVFFDGQVGLLVEEGGIGAVISLVILVGAIALGRGPSRREGAELSDPEAVRRRRPRPALTNWP